LNAAIIEMARRYVAAAARCKAIGKGGRDEKRQLAHDALMYALMRRHSEINPNDYAARQQANELAFKIVRWHGR
jgi:hypothetical protein